MPFFSLGPEGRKQLEQFGRVSTLGLELGLSIALGFWGGQWLDRKFGTGGWLTWVGFALGLAAGTRSIYSLVQKTRSELSKTTTHSVPEKPAPAPEKPAPAPATCPDYDDSDLDDSQTSPDYDSSPRYDSDPPADPNAS